LPDEENDDELLREPSPARNAHSRLDLSFVSRLLVLRAGRPIASDARDQRGKGLRLDPARSGAERGVARRCEE
jgi:hypothetical protein